MAINERNYVGYAISPRTGRPHALRHLPTMAEWEPGIYMYEAGDKFVADIDGIDNLPAQQLANRTEFLKEQNALLAQACKGLVAIARATTVGRIPDNGYRVALSHDRPKGPCAWVRPMEDIGSVTDSPFYVGDTEGDLRQSPVMEIVTGEDTCLGYPGILVTDTAGNEWASPVRQKEATGGMACYVGGSGDSFPRVITVAGSVTLTLSPADPRQRVAWARTEGEAGQLDLASSEIVLEDGKKILNPTFQVIRDTDDAYYVRTYAPDTDPLYEETVEVNGFEVTTHGDIDAMLAR